MMRIVSRNNRSIGCPYSSSTFFPNEARRRCAAITALITACNVRSGCKSERREPSAMPSRISLRKALKPSIVDLAFQREKAFDRPVPGVHCIELRHEANPGLVLRKLIGHVLKQRGNLRKPARCAFDNLLGAAPRFPPAPRRGSPRRCRPCWRSTDTSWKGEVRWPRSRQPLWCGRCHALRKAFRPRRGYAAAAARDERDRRSSLALNFFWASGNSLTNRIATSNSNYQYELQ